MPANLERTSLFSQITLNHGPIGLLGRFLLKAEAACRWRGIYLKLGTPTELMKANDDNLSTWSPLLSLFDNRFNDLNPSNTFAILGCNEVGKVVACQAARHFEWKHSNYYEECSSLRLFYCNPDADRLSKERCDVSALITKSITGSVTFSGAAWCLPAYRGMGLIEIMPRIARALAYTRWKSDFTVTMMTEYNVRKQVFKRSGYNNIEFDIDVISSRAGSARAAFLWLKEQEMLADLTGFLSHFEAEIELGIDTRRANQ
jgi:hypothetical protein